MNLLSAENLSKQYGEYPLFEGINLGIAQGQKVALVGINGSGKSTLLRILAGLEPPDTGKVVYRTGLNLVYLSQDPKFAPDATVRESVFATGNADLDLIAEYESLLLRNHNEPGVAKRLETVMGEIDARGAWGAEAEVHAVLTKLDVGDLDRKVSSLSGGQRKRVAMAQALVTNPDLIILDEPTNHLDLESIEWLEDMLSTAKQSLILVTHDRYFLDRVANEIFEIDQQKLFRYPGSYSAFLEKKAERESMQTAERDKARSLYSRELEWLRRSPKARTTKSRSRIQAAGVLEEKTHAPQSAGELRLDVYGRRIGGNVLEIKNLRKAIGEKKLVEHFTYTFNKLDRIGVVGPNGVGKTTFLRLLAGEMEADIGKIRWGDTIVPGYYRQETPIFKPNIRVIEAVTELAEMVTLSKKETISASQMLEHFMFPPHTHHKMVETLSGGEKRRLHLLRILMTNPNFLILDEPTNDLDLVTLGQLEIFLQDFQGCLLVVTHDRYFMDKLVDHLFVFEGEGEIRDFPGNYTDYRQEQNEKKALGNSEVKSKPAAPVVIAEKPKNRPRKLSFNEQRELTQLETLMPELETRIATLNSQLEVAGADYEAAGRIAADLEQARAELDAKSDRWLELQAIVEGEE